MHVEDVMHDVEIIDENADVKAAADLMAKKQIGSLVVVGRGRVVGIVTERDFLECFARFGKGSKKLKVKDIMSKNVITITPDALLEDAAALMAKHKVKRLPVVKDGLLVGIITASDVIANAKSIGELSLF
ncbi:hypothetical protein DRJ19_01285 [Candidatus Woesearchaeota archaeon]|nr:MAG: hypothetical protein DRJ19_01285 [Candidatus Woesearchaeota archaeon]